MLTSRFITAFLVSTLLLLSACASKPLLVREHTKIDTLGVCVDFNEHITAPEKLLYLEATEEFVNENRKNKSRNWQLDTCNTSQKYQLDILVQNTKFVEPSQQAMYVILSTAGILYPLNGGAFGFFWLGFNTSNLEVSVSDDLKAGSKRPVFRQVYSSPYFKGSDALRIKHMESYKVALGKLIQDLQYQLDMPATGHKS